MTVHGLPYYYLINSKKYIKNIFWGELIILSNSRVRVIKVCIVRLVHIYLKNLRQLFDKYAVVRTEHDTFVKSMTKIFSNFVAFSVNSDFKGQ